MSRTEDRYRLKDAEKRGYWEGREGVLPEVNPYRALGTRNAWNVGWERGKKDQAEIDQSEKK